MNSVRLAIVLPGLHRVNRGAETAFESVAREIARIPGWTVTVFGSGHPRPEEPYKFVHVPCAARERFEGWPRGLLLRSETTWEELSFVRQLWKRYKPSDFDATMACSFPFCNWFLRWRTHCGRKPVHVYVTQNGDWPCHRKNSEYRWFDCDALVCTNPEYYERHKAKFRASLIPNGVDPCRFHPGPRDRSAFGLPANAKLILMVSALIPSKRVIEGIEAASKVEGAWLVIAGDGPLRDIAESKGRELLGDRFCRMTVQRERMSELYRCADTMLHMSIDEPSANAYIEALASGLPIVTHDRSVTRWTLGDTSYLVDTEDVDATTNAIRKALDETPGLRTGERLTLVNNRYKWTSIAIQYTEAITAAFDAMTGSSQGTVVQK